MIKLTVDIADTPGLQSQGLMWVKELPDNHGMLFKFPHQVEASFWGKNTYIPLDVAFVDRDGKITEIKSIVPMSTRTVRSKDLCSMAIEANAGFFDKNKISAGHRIYIKENEILFSRDQDA